MISSFVFVVLRSRLFSLQHLTAAQPHPYRLTDPPQWWVPPLWRHLQIGTLLIIYAYIRRSNFCSHKCVLDSVCMYHQPLQRRNLCVAIEMWGWGFAISGYREKTETPKGGSITQCYMHDSIHSIKRSARRQQTTTGALHKMSGCRLADCFMVLIWGLSILHDLYY